MIATDQPGSRPLADKERVELLAAIEPIQFSRRCARGLGWTAAGLYLLSFALPVFSEDRVLWGWEAAWHSIYGSVVGTWEVLFDRGSQPMYFDGFIVLWYLGSTANLLFLAVAVFHRKLALLPRWLIGCLTGAATTATLTPAWLSMVQFSFGGPATSGIVWDTEQAIHVYRGLSFGYWCWLGAMVLAELAAVVHWRGLRSSPARAIAVEGDR